MHSLWLQRLNSVDQIAVFEEGIKYKGTPPVSLSVQKSMMPTCGETSNQRSCLRKLVLTHTLAPDETRDQ